MVWGDRIATEEKEELKGEYHQYGSIAFCRITFFLLSLGVLAPWAALMEFPALVTQGVWASQSVVSFVEKVKATVKTLSVSLMDPVSRNNIGEAQAKIDKIISEDEKKGRPIRFGIGILDKSGIAVAGRYVVGTFRKDDFSRYQFVRKVFRQKKIIQDRLYFQDRSELWIVCVPLVAEKNVIGAVVLGFNPAELKKDYGLNAEQFLALDLNKSQS